MTNDIGTKTVDGWETHTTKECDLGWWRVLKEQRDGKVRKSGFYFGYTWYTFQFLRRVS